MNINFNSYELVAYFTASLMYSLNKFANEDELILIQINKNFIGE